MMTRPERLESTLRSRIADFRLGRSGRRSTLITHIVSTGSWLGLDVAAVLLIVTALCTDDPYLAGLCLRIFPVFLWPLFLAGLASLITGLILSAGTKYGVLRYRWVTVKLLITLLYLTLIPVGLAPTALDRATLGQALLDGRTQTVDVGDLIYPAVAGPALLLTAMILSVAKPRLRRN